MPRDIYIHHHGFRIATATFALLFVSWLAACDRGRQEPQQIGTQQKEASPVPEAEAFARNELVSTTIPPGRDKPHLLKLVRVTLPAGASMDHAGAERVVFQISGSQTITVEGKSRTLKPDDGMRIETGLPAKFTAEGDKPSLSLHYFLVPSPQADRAMKLEGGEATELYRTPEPVTELADKPHVLTLTHMTLPSSTSQTTAHTGTGTALYYVLAGTGQVSSQGTTEQKQPGNVVYEASGVPQQWANPGDQPLTLVVARLSPQAG